MSYRFVANFKLTSNSQLFQLDVPIDLRMGNSKFEISSIMGKMKNSASAILVTCPELTTSQSWFSVNDANNVIAQTALTTTVSQPVSFIPTKEDIAFICPSFIRDNPRLTIQLRDEDGDLLDDSNIDFVIIQICFFTPNH